MQKNSDRIDQGLADCDPLHQSYLKAGLKAARAGRQELLKYYGQLRNIESKFQAGLVTEADRASEAAIQAILQVETPDIAFLGEEGSHSHTVDSGAALKAKRRWIVDPLDGTTNYVHGFPFFAVSIGLEIDGQLIAGIVDAPILGEVYCALLGGGSYQNGKRLQVQPKKPASECFVATGFFTEKDQLFDEQINVFKNTAKLYRGVRRPGSAALDLCYVARGTFDLYFERGLSAWDSAAGALIVNEAGGLCQTYKGKSYNPFHNSIVAGSASAVQHFVTNVGGLIGPDVD